MAAISKQQILKLGNADIAELTGFADIDVQRAFENYNRLIESQEGSSSPLDGFLRATENAGIRDVDKVLGRALLDAGRLERSIGELAIVPGIGFKTVRNMIPALARLDIPAPEPGAPTGERKVRRSITPRSRIDPYMQLATLSTLGSQLLPRGSILPDDLIDFFEELGDDIETIGDTVEEGKDLVDAVKEAIKKIKEAKDVLKGKNPRPPSIQSAGGSTLTHPETPGKIDGEIEEDEYVKIFGEALASEPIYFAYFDRWMAYEVDGFFDDNIYAAVEAKVFLTDPPTRIRSSFITSVYDFDEREEYRLKPKLPIGDRRDLPLDEDDWKIRGFLEPRDAALALRVKGDVRGIPLSRLESVEISLYLYESRAVQALIAAVAALGAAAIAALGIIKGKFTAPAGSTAEVTAAIERGLQRLNELIADDVKLIVGQFTFRPAQFEEAFRSGQTFPVPERGTTAACGMPFQRMVGAIKESGEPDDTLSADDFLQRNQSKLRDPDFYEDEFDSFYDIRVRFERLDARGS